MSSNFYSRNYFPRMFLRLIIELDIKPCTGSQEALEECSNQHVFDPYRSSAGCRPAFWAKEEHVSASVPPPGGRRGGQGAKSRQVAPDPGGLSGPSARRSPAPPAWPGDTGSQEKGQGAEWPRNSLEARARSSARALSLSPSFLVGVFSAAH